MDPYKVLGVERDASDETLKRAFRSLAKKCHPDLFHTDEEKAEATEKFKTLNAAWELIGTSESRAIYDASNPVVVNVYEYYSNKKTSHKGHEDCKSKRSDVDIENEKQRKAILQFLNVEYEHKEEIFEMFSELATGALNGVFSAEEYIEMLELVLQEQQDCIKKIKQIIRVAKEKNLTGMEEALIKAKQVIEELTQKAKETPRTLTEAHYVEETRILTEKVNKLIAGFPDRVNFISNFDLLEKTWEFNNDSEITSYCKKIKKKVAKTLNDIRWVEKITNERNIKIGTIALGDPNSRWESDRDERTLKQLEEIVLDKSQVLILSLQKLREKFWEERCDISKNSKGQVVFSGTKWNTRNCKGTFICPANVTSIDRDAFDNLKEMSAISLSASLISDSYSIAIPYKIKELILNFDKKTQVVNISNFDTPCIIRKKQYICIKHRYDSQLYFILVDENGVYVYEDSKLCQLMGVETTKEVEELTHKWRYKFQKYHLQIHAWAQVSKRLPQETVMRFIPANAESAKRWLEIDKTNFEKVLSQNSVELEERIIRLYVALGALGDEYSHMQAEYLIAQLDIEGMYRSRLERIPQENIESKYRSRTKRISLWRIGDEEKVKKDPMGYVPKEAVEFVKSNICNKEFMPYILTFLEGYQIFNSEAKKAGVKLSPEFVIITAPQYIFHAKTNETQEFAKQVLNIERSVEKTEILEKILKLNAYAQKQLNMGIKKKIIETVDIDEKSLMHYRYLDLSRCQTYLDFAHQFLIKKDYGKKRNRFFSVEAENVFVSSNSHAIEIVDSENKRIAIVILNLFDEGELFADIMSCETKSMDVIQVIKRALKDQMHCNSRVTGISIGTNEAPRGERFNEWRNVLEDSNVDWIKFEVHFKNREIGIGYKGYRARFMIEGNEQRFARPHRHRTYAEIYQYYQWQRRINRRNNRLGW
ncbi:MAG: J domain-containing protein [Clostridia bacterium]|nr:J domain-containing protein [Clostridia bacterium]